MAGYTGKSKSPRGKASVELKINVGAIKGSVDRLIDNETMLYAHAQLANYLSPYVPMDQGALSENTIATAGFLLYDEPYAHKQYVGLTKDGREFDYRTDKHAKASAEWDKAAMEEVGPQYAEEMEDYLKKKARRLK